MNRIILVLILVVTFSCMDNKKKEPSVVSKEVVEKQYNLIKNFTIDEMELWSKVRVNLEASNEVEYSEAAYNLSRNSETESAYLSSGLIPVTYSSEYMVSIIVKKGVNNNLFGLRISGVYPDRVDAIFDLDKGIVVDYRTAQDFENAEATIVKLSDGWYKCTLSSEVSADNIKIVMGATSAENSITSWEGKSENQGGIFFVPTSVTIEEVIVN